MTNKDSQPDDVDDGQNDVGGFRFPMADGGGDEPRERTDGAGETGRGFPDVENDGSREADGGHAIGRPEFTGFDFGTWLEETEARATTTVEETATETADAPATDREVEPAFAGFDFRQWMESDDAQGPAEPPDTARVVTQSIAEVDPAAAATSESAAFSGDVGAAAPTGFAFAEWLGESDTEFIDPEAIQPATEAAPEPSAPSTVSAGAAMPSEGGYPTPPGGGFSELPPVKVAVFALFAATLAAVALTIAGPVAPLGPATGFANPAPSNAGGAPAATATPTPTPAETPQPTDTPTATPTDEPSTPTETATPTATETTTPTPTPTPTATPTATESPTPTPTGTDDDGGGILDPIIGG